MKKTLRMKCPSCGHWNRIQVNKIFIEQPSSEPKVRVIIPFYEPIKVERCQKCKNIIAEPRELIRITSLKHFKSVQKSV
jgi:phage FluMu protein Com